MKIYSDGYLMKLWRKAVLFQWGNRCAFCGKHIDQTEIECHHIVKRKHKLLRWNWRNGIPLCKWGCHQEGHTKAGEQRISKLNPFYDMLVYWENKVSKQQLLTEGKTENEFRQEIYDDLQEAVCN